jgi:hypothetical protein
VEKGWTPWSTHRVVRARILLSLVLFGHVTAKLCSSQIMELSYFRYSYPPENRNMRKSGESKLSHCCFYYIALHFPPPHQKKKIKKRKENEKVI